MNFELIRAWSGILFSLAFLIFSVLLLWLIVLFSLLIRFLPMIALVVTAAWIVHLGFF